jgi:hypothetical protein
VVGTLQQLLLQGRQLLLLLLLRGAARRLPPLVLLLLQDLSCCCCQLIQAVPHGKLPWGVLHKALQQRTLQRTRLLLLLLLVCLAVPGLLPSSTTPGASLSRCCFVHRPCCITHTCMPPTGANRAPTRPSSSSSRPCSATCSEVLLCADVVQQPRGQQLLQQALCGLLLLLPVLPLLVGACQRAPPPVTSLLLLLLLPRGSLLWLLGVCREAPALPAPCLGVHTSRCCCLLHAARHGRHTL